LCLFLLSMLSVVACGNAAPIADISVVGPGAYEVGEEVMFSGTGSNDPDGYIESYLWDFGDGGVGFGAVTEHTFYSKGQYLVELTVVDSAGSSATASIYANIVGIGPKASMSVAGGGMLAVQTAAYFDGTSSTDEDGTIVSYKWDFGDGKTASGSTTDHSYSSAGEYTVELTVVDDDGLADTCSHRVSVSPHIIAIDIDNCTTWRAHEDPYDICGKLVEELGEAGIAAVEGASDSYNATLSVWYDEFKGGKYIDGDGRFAGYGTIIRCTLRLDVGETASRVIQAETDSRVSGDLYDNAIENFCAELEDALSDIVDTFKSNL